MHGLRIYKDFQAHEYLSTNHTYTHPKDIRFHIETNS